MTSQTNNKYIYRPRGVGTLNIRIYILPQIVLTSDTFHNILNTKTSLIIQGLQREALTQMKPSSRATNPTHTYVNVSSNSSAKLAIEAYVSVELKRR